MSSGKQLSFIYGEVSPSLRYKSDEVSYGQGLAKLRNMYVRRAGGVSNRPGFEYIQIASTQKDLPSLGGKAGIKAFTWWDAENNVWRTAEYGKHSQLLYGPAPGYVPYYEDKYKFAIDGVLEDEHFIEPSPNEVRFTLLKEKIFVSPKSRVAILDAAFNPLPHDHITILNNGGGLRFNYGLGGIGTHPLAGTSLGLSPFLSVSYLVTAVFKDGREVRVAVMQGTQPTPATISAGNIAHPHAQLSTTLVLTTTGGEAYWSPVKAFNFYRGAGNAGFGGSFYQFAGAVPFSDYTKTSVSFTDYGVSNPSVTAPIDSGIYDEAKQVLRGALCASYYQQRLVLGMEQGPEGSGIRAGDMYASKLGAPEQLKSPIVYTDVGAFQFNIPVTDGTPCVAQLSMERLIAFTGKGVYIVRGGEQGVLTPTQVNPLIVSNEGCSSSVEPKSSGRKGYFLNNSHTKLMAIEFSIDGNLNISEASAFSEHTLDQDIVQMEVLNGTEDTVYLLRRDGKLVRITNSGNDNLGQGFAVLETDGYIESIYLGKAKNLYYANSVDSLVTDKYYDVLMCYVIRNGVRLVERLNTREDKFREAEFFADSFKSFGYRLSNNGNEGYARIDSAGIPLPLATRINIETPGSGIWTAGETIKLRTTLSSSEIIKDSDNCILHFFYDSFDIDGKFESVQTLRYHVTNGSLVATGDPTFLEEYSGFFDQDVPEVLQDVNAQALTDAQKKNLQTRCLQAFNSASLSHGTLLYAFTDPESLVAETSLKGVSVFADGEVISSPNNPHKNTLYVDKDVLGVSKVNLPDHYCYGYVGIPYMSEFETMDIETSGERTLTDANKLINAVGLGMMETRGAFIGLPGKDLTNMEELDTRMEGDLSITTPNFNGHKVVNFPTEWNGPGRVNIKNVDPVPMTILSVYPKGISGD